jgi:nicotinamidase/pyrazinamidase
MEIKDISYIGLTMLKENDALIVVDIQNDFMPDGALPVKEGDTIVTGVNKTMNTFHKSGLTIVLTQDWHPANHQSFASVHKGKKPYDPFEAPGIGPVLWPDHCVQGTRGAEFHKNLETTLAHAIVRKGYKVDIDSYSGFRDNDKKAITGLDGFLKGKGISRIFLCGLALDYCVFFTASDGADMGFDVIVITDLTRAVGEPEDSISNALEDMLRRDIKFVRPDSIQSP